MGIIEVFPMLGLPGAISDQAFAGDLIQMFVHAGTVVKIVLMILMFFSIISWTIIFMKWRFISKAKHETAYFLDIFWENTELQKLYRETDDLKYSPTAQLYRTGYAELVRVNKIRNTSSSTGEPGLNGFSDSVERALRKAQIQQGARLDKALSFLATTGSTAPFVGLFGTVWGIMESFRGIGMKGSASLAVVAPGISEALIATAVGLAAAIPAQVAFNHFNNKAQELRSEMDTFAADFLSRVMRYFIKKNVNPDKD
jgi:biopolymer transport protein TolQ